MRRRPGTCFLKNGEKIAYSEGRTEVLRRGAPHNGKTTVAGRIYFNILQFCAPDDRPALRSLPRTRLYYI